MKGSLFLLCVVLISVGNALLTCSNDDSSFNSWLCGLQDWTKSMKEWRNRIELDCSEEHLGTEWNELFTCSDSITVTCCDGTEGICEMNVLNCSICYCTDGKYSNRQKYQELHRRYQIDYQKTMALYDQKLRYCERRFTVVGNRSLNSRTECDVASTTESSTAGAVKQPMTSAEFKKEGTTDEAGVSTTHSTSTVETTSEVIVTTKQDHATTEESKTTPEVTTDSQGTTKETRGTTEKPTTTVEATTDSQGTTKESHDTTEEPTSTAEATTESRDSTAEEEISTVTLTCPSLISNDTCKVIYDGKCFTWIIPGPQNVDLAKANKLCSDEGFQLGNIYDDCQFKLVMDKLVDETFLNNKVWTGMTLDIESGEVDTAHSSTGEDVTILSDWQYPDYPNPDGGRYLFLKVSKFPPPSKTGIYNYADSLFTGAFCERA